VIAIVANALRASMRAWLCAGDLLDAQRPLNAAKVKSGFANAVRRVASRSAEAAGARLLATRREEIWPKS
jgi:hypothetical protein